MYVQINKYDHQDIMYVQTNDCDPQDIMSNYPYLIEVELE